MNSFRTQLKTGTLPSGREVNPFQDQRQLRTRYFQRVLFLQGDMIRNLIRSFLQLLVPDAETHLAPVEDFDAIASPIHEYEQAP